MAYVESQIDKLDFNDAYIKFMSFLLLSAWIFYKTIIVLGAMSTSERILKNRMSGSIFFTKVQLISAKFPGGVFSGLQALETCNQKHCMWRTDKLYVLL